MGNIGWLDLGCLVNLFWFRRGFRLEEEILDSLYLFMRFYLNLSRFWFIRFRF